jgi:hypothetical protein
MLSDLFRKQPIAMAAGAISFIGFLIMIGFALADPTEVLGVNRWIKPMKFFVSISVFMWTIGIYLYQLRGWERFSRRISLGLSAVFVIEMAAIVGQAARGTTSHFNIGNAFDGAVFAIMGVAIAASTLMTASILYPYFKSATGLSANLILGLRLGLIVFLTGSVIGGYMSAQTGHAVGVADGGPGLPIVNWSTIGGDLRVGHFLGLHALQAIPLAALVVEKLAIRRAYAVTAAFAAVYTLLVAAIFVQALAGRPFIAM